MCERSTRGSRWRLLRWSVAPVEVQTARRLRGDRYASPLAATDVGGDAFGFRLGGIVLGRDDAEGRKSLRACSPLLHHVGEFMRHRGRIRFLVSERDGIPVRGSARAERCELVRCSGMGDDVSEVLAEHRLHLAAMRHFSALPNSLTAEQLAEFLTAMRKHYPQHYALVMLLAYTGLRWCHASALRWEDFDEQAGVLRIERKQVRGVVGPVSRKKRAPKEYPIEPELAEILKWHRQRLLKDQAPGLEAGWMFPSSTGTLRTPNSLDRAWAKCLTAAEITHRFTVHGLRYTFTDLVRRANVDAVVRRALTGHVTEEMQRRYSTVGMDEKRAAVAGVIRLVPPQKRSAPVCDGAGGTGGGTKEPKRETA